MYHLELEYHGEHIRIEWNGQVNGLTIIALLATVLKMKERHLIMPQKF